MRSLPCVPNWPPNLPGLLWTPQVQIPLLLLLLPQMVLKRPFLRPPWVLLPLPGLLSHLVVLKPNSVVVLLLLVAFNLSLGNKDSNTYTFLDLAKCPTLKLVVVLVAWVLTPGGC